jgi:hypothetical protein
MKCPICDSSIEGLGLYKADVNFDARAQPITLNCPKCYTHKGSKNQGMYEEAYLFLVQTVKLSSN